MDDAPSTDAPARVEAPDFISFLPDRVYYLTSNGRDMWCRRPYTFFFTSGEAAERFAVAMESQLTLQAIGVASKELVSEQGVQALRRLEVTRVFLDPQRDPATGEVFGPILRLAEVS